MASAGWRRRGRLVYRCPRDLDVDVGPSPRRTASPGLGERPGASGRADGRARVTAALRPFATKRRLVARIAPLRRVAAADEVAEAILWLLSDRASYVSGAVVKVTGGL